MDTSKSTISTDLDKTNMETQLKVRINDLQIEVERLSKENKLLKGFRTNAGNYLCELAESDFTEKHWDNRKSKNNEWFDFNRAKARIIEGMLYEEIARELGSITKCWTCNNGMVAGTASDKKNCRCRACIALNKLNYLTHRKEKPEWMSELSWNMNRD